MTCDRIYGRSIAGTKKIKKEKSVEVAQDKKKEMQKYAMQMMMMTCTRKHKKLTKKITEGRNHDS
jgi:hypothetical protein